MSENTTEITMFTLQTIHSTSVLVKIFRKGKKKKIIKHC